MGMRHETPLLPAACPAPALPLAVWLFAKLAPFRVMVLECRMNIYRFVSDSTPSVSAFTLDRTGDNLPADYAPWRAVGGRVVFIGAGDPVARVVAKDGLFLLSGRHGPHPTAH
jgi:hypothetical protein